MDPHSEPSGSMGLQNKPETDSETILETFGRLSVIMETVHAGTQTSVSKFGRVGTGNSFGSLFQPFLKDSFFANSWSFVDSVVGKAPGRESNMDLLAMPELTQRLCFRPEFRALPIKTCESHNDQNESKGLQKEPVWTSLWRLCDMAASTMPTNITYAWRFHRCFHLFLLNSSRWWYRHIHSSNMLL